jgi:hypothetical protein
MEEIYWVEIQKLLRAGYTGLKQPNMQYLAGYDRKILYYVINNSASCTLETEMV